MISARPPASPSITTTSGVKRFIASSALSIARNRSTGNTRFIFQSIAGENQTSIHKIQTPKGVSPSASVLFKTGVCVV